MSVQRSAGDSDNRYMNPGFYSKPENQFWNNPHQNLVDQNGHVDVVYSTNNKGKEYFNKCLEKRETYEKRYKSHSL